MGGRLAGCIWVALTRECVRVLTLCAFAMKIFVKESGGERRRVVVGLSCMLFGDGSVGAKRHLFFLVFLQFLVCARQDIEELYWR